MKDIIGYEGIYAADESGQIWSYRRKKFLNPFSNASSYPQVALYLNGKKKTYFVHRLIAETFLDNPDNKPHVHHIDGNRLNASLSNLQWVTQEENNNDEIHKARCNTRSRKVLCVETNTIYNSLTEAAKTNNCSVGNICHCCQIESRTIAGYHWKYIEV